MAASTSIISKNNKMLGRFLALSFSFLCLVPQAYGAAAVAAADTLEGISYFFVGSQPTVAKARELVLRNCRNGSGPKEKCSIAGATEGPKYWAVFHASNGSIGLAWNSDRQKAIDEAYASCSKRGACANDAENVWFDEGQTVAQAPASSGNCTPPSGNVVHSQFACNGGDCVRRFDNGCTVRFQAPSCYDPVQQKWDWKPNGC